ncbi:hypothetical protein Tco_0672116 [Tanacetum coccineum]
MPLISSLPTFTAGGIVGLLVMLVSLGDDDNLPFAMRSSSTPVSWLDSHTESMIAAMLGVWHCYSICKSEPRLLWSHPKSMQTFPLSPENIRRVEYWRAFRTFFNRFYKNVAKENPNQKIVFLAIVIEAIVLVIKQIVWRFEAVARSEQGAIRSAPGGGILIVNALLSLPDINVYALTRDRANELMQPRDELGFNFFSSTMGTIDSMKSVLTQSALDALCEKFHIPDVVHPELPGRNDRIRNSPAVEYFQINLSQLSVIATAKVSHFEILCHVHGFVPTVADASAFPFAVPWHNDKTLRKDPHPAPAEFNADVCNYLADNPALFRVFLEPFLYFIGISRYYDLDENCYPTFWANDDEEMDLFAFINNEDPTKGNVNVQGAGIDIVADDETQAIVADKPKRLRKKRKAVDGASGSGLPPKKLKEDHGVSGDVGASTAGKSLVVLQGLLDSSTLAAKIGAIAATTIPFIASFVTPTPEREGGRHGDSVTGPNLRTQLTSERFVVLTDSSHHSSTHAADDEVTSIVRSSVPPPPVLIVAVATTIIADVTSAPAPRANTGQVPPSIFRDSASTSKANQDITGPSHPVGTELSTDSLFVLQDVDSETLHQIYIPKWNVTNDYALDDPDICHGVIDHLAPPAFFSQLHSMD